MRPPGGNVTYRDEGDGWMIEAYAQAQRFRPGKVPTSRDAARADGRTWTLHVRRTPVGLQAERFSIDCRWTEGDPSVLLVAVS